MVTEPNEPPIRFEEHPLKMDQIFTEKTQNSLREQNNTTVHTLALGEESKRLKLSRSDSTDFMQES